MKRNAIVGLNSAGFVTSSALLVDGQLEFAVEEERLIREKRTRKFPVQGIKAALSHAGITLGDVSSFATAWNPAINLEAHLPAQSERARYLGEIFYSVPSSIMNLSKKPAGDHSRHDIVLEDGTTTSIYYITHHLTHASSFFMSPFEEAAVLSVDAFGEKDCCLFMHGTGSTLKPLWSQEFPHSLGAFYSTFTEFAGFHPQSDEWKLMGASSYSKGDRFYKKISELIELRDDGGFELALSYFNHYQFHRPGRYTRKMIDHLGIEPNPLDKPLTEEYYDLCAAAQRVMEDIYFHMLTSLHKKTQCSAVVLSGGVALNSVANGKIFSRTPFKDVFISSTPDDSGGAAGAALYLYHHLQGNPRSFVLRSNYLGPGYTDDEIERTLKNYKLTYRKVPNVAVEAAKKIAEGKILGWFQGRLEFGDRALGNRSILADPRDESMKEKVNATVKYREMFRPFAPSILCEYTNEFFVDAYPTPFMEKVFIIRDEKRAVIPAVTHVDGSGRLQTVSKEQNPLYWSLIDEFRKLTGVPVVLNTSFNLKGEPIVCSPSDAIRTFHSSGLDVLVLGSYILEKGRA